MTIIPAEGLVGDRVTIRPVAASDLETIVQYGYTVSIINPLDDAGALAAAFDETGFLAGHAGAVAITENGAARLVGTAQWYRSAPCIHGLEIGYIIHAEADRGQGFAAEALRLLSDRLFATQDGVARIQLLIGVWNVASHRVAERCGFLREGVLRSAGFGDDPGDCFVYSRTRRDYLHQHGV